MSTKKKPASQEANFHAEYVRGHTRAVEVAEERPMIEVRIGVYASRASTIEAFVALAEFFKSIKKE